MVAGLVLVDSTSEDLKVLDELDLAILNAESDDKAWLDKCKDYSLLSQEEIRKVINPIFTEKSKHFPNYIRQRLIDFQLKPSIYKAMYSEINNWQRDAEIIKKLGRFPNTPLFVIGRDKEFNIQLGIEDGLPEREIRLLEEKWQELIIDQLNLSNHSELLFVQEASHSIHLDRPDIIIESILKFVEKVI
ncbi:alpha/beta hydrolase [Paenibacillus sp. N1-5-1-14]|uniref:alpha/beta hydrolase n=1 Tax=Paenibacillus radicibacter TaxID=2972488 RepID=UPI0021596CDD|nr:alpha/beta hydrolase [Paenibacillus radicibacter]MCR8642963.1 alpha/beta hydrolase [Paenibacillus radicibacter]